MSSGFGNFGASFGAFATGGGGLSPASKSSIIQWLKGGTSDGINMTDLINPTLDAEIRNVNVIDFDGPSYVDFGNLEEVQMAGDNFAVSFWIKTTDSVAYLVSNHNTGAQSWAVALSGGKLFLQTSSNGTATTTFQDAVTNVNDGAWHFCEIFKYGTTAYSYVDGVASDSGTVDATLFDSSSDFEIGGRNNGASGAFIGNITDVCVKREAGNNIDVILLLGQSNAQGQTGLTGPIGYTDVQFHKFGYSLSGGSLQSNLTDLDDIGTAWGMELSAGVNITEYDGRQVAFIKVTKGATKLGTSGSGGNWAQTKDMYVELQTQYAATMSALWDAGFNPIVRQIWWHQGESDSNNVTDANNYATNFNQFLSDIYDDMGIDVPVVMGIIRDSEISPRIYHDTVVAQIRQLGTQSNISLIETSDLTLGADQIHFDSDALITLGERFSDRYIENIEERFSDNIVFYAPLQEGSGATVYDISQYANTGTLTGAWTTSDDAISHNALYGCTESVGVYIPAKKPPLETVGIFTKNNEYINFGVQPTELMSTGVFDIRFKFLWNSSDIANYNRLMYFTTAAGGYFKIERNPGGAFSFRAKNDSGLFVFPNTGFSVPSDTLHYVRLIGDGTKCDIYVDGTLSATSVANTSNFYTPTFNLVAWSNTSFDFSGKLAMFDMQWASDRQTILLNEGYGTTTAYDSSGNGNNATLVNITEAFWGDVELTADKELLAADGSTIANPKGFVHSGSEVSIVQTDGVTPTFGTGTISFWSSDGTALDEKTKAQMDTHFNNTNGSYGLWIKKIGDYIYEMVQYPLANELTEADVYRNEAYFRGTSGALRDVNGDLITDVNGYVIFAS